MDLHQTVDAVARLLRGEVRGGGARARERTLHHLRALDAAGPHDLGAVFRPEYQGAARRSAAGCLLVPQGFDLGDDDERVLIEVADPELAVDTLAATWGPREEGPDAGVHPLALVEDGAEVDPSAGVGPWAYVGRGAVVGPGSRLWARSYVGAGARVGAGCKLYPGVFLGDRCVLGDRVIVHAGAALGADGFGFRRGDDGRHHKSPQVGIVRVGDDVEIGANTTIDRARFEATVLEHGVKIDDQVHIAHNCVVGEDTAMAGHTSLAGGARLGKRVLVAGRAAVNGGVSVGDDTVLGAAAIVLKDVGPRQFVLGYPAGPAARWKRQVASLNRLPAHMARGRAGRDGEEGTGGA